MTVKFHAVGEIDDALLKYAVIVSRCDGKWVWCKHRKRDTWEVPGGRREGGEDIIETAKRELYEETGAVEFDLTPVCVYSVSREETESFGLLCFAEIKRLGALPDTEIEKTELFDETPENCTYPDIQPKLTEKIKEIYGGLHV